MAVPASAETVVLDVHTTARRLDEAVSEIVAGARAGAGGYGCLCNVHVLMTARREAGVRGALAGASWVFADGAPIAWLQRRGGAAAAERVAGAELMWRVLDQGRAAGLRHALFGSTPAVLTALQERIASDLPAATIVAAISPAFEDGAADAAATLDELAAAGPQIVWCALGAPRQELWMHRHAERLAPAVLLGVGAAFDFLAASKPRAPEWMQSLGLEWLHRLVTEPRRLGGRYLSTNTRFIVTLATRSARRR